MVDTGTLNRLSVDEENEYHYHSMRFIKAVLQSSAVDGRDFQKTYHVASDGQSFFLSNGSAPFAGIKCRSQKVIEALLADAVQNHGR